MTDGSVFLQERKDITQFLMVNGGFVVVVCYYKLSYDDEDPSRILQKGHLWMTTCLDFIMAGMAQMAKSGQRMQTKTEAANPPGVRAFFVLV